MAYCIKIFKKQRSSRNKEDKTGLCRIFLFAFPLFYDIIKPYVKFPVYRYTGSRQGNGTAYVRILSGLVGGQMYLDDGN